MKSRYPSLDDVIQNCIDRNCTPEQLQDFIDRARRQHMDNPEMLQIIDGLEMQHLVSADLEGAETA